MKMRLLEVRVLYTVLNYRYTELPAVSVIELILRR